MNEDNKSKSLNHIALMHMAHQQMNKDKRLSRRKRYLDNLNTNDPLFQSAINFELTR